MAGPNRDDSGRTLTRAWRIGVVALSIAGCSGDGGMPVMIGQPVLAPLAGGAEHETDIPCRHGDTLLITVAQDNVDLIVETAESGSTTTGHTSPGGRFGEELVVAECRSNDPLRFILRNLHTRVSTGHFRLTAQRFVPNGSSRLLAAYRHMSEASRIYAVGGHEAWLSSADHLERARRLWRALGMRKYEALCEYQLGSIYYLNVLDWRKGSEHAGRALGIYRTLSDPQGQAAAATLRGAALGELAFALGASDGQSRTKSIFAESEQLLRGARAGLMRQGRGFDAAVSLNYLAVSHYYSGQYEQAIAGFADAEREFHALGEHAARVRSLQNVATILWEFGRHRESLAAFGRLLPMIHEADDSLTYAAVMGNFVNVLRDTGDLENALARALDTLELNRRREDRGGEARSLHKIADIYFLLGDLRQALQFYNQALPREKQANQRKFMFRTLISIGNIQRDLGDLAAATRFHRDALELVHSRTDRAQLLLSMGMDHAVMGNHEAALASFEASMNASPPDRSPYFLVALMERGRTLAVLKQYGPAREDLLEAAVLAEGADRPLERAAALRELALVESGRGNMLAAQSTIEEAIKAVESVHVHTLSPSIRASFRANRRDIYSTRIGLLMKRAEDFADSASAVASPLEGSWVTAALVAAEEARARWLTDISAARRHQGEAAQNANRELDLLFDALAERRSALDNLQHSGNEQFWKVEAMQAEIAMLRTRATLKEAQLLADQGPVARRLLDDASLKQFQQSLPAGTAAVEFLLAAPHSWAWIVTAERICAVRLPDKARIESLVGRFATELRKPGSMEAAIRNARAVHEEVLRPVLSASMASDLVMVPDGILHTIPLQTVMQLAGDQHTSPVTVTLMPSINSAESAVTRSRTQDSLERILIVLGSAAGSSDPRRLAGTDREGLEIRRIMGPSNTSVVSGNDAWDLLQEAPPAYDILHIATHAVYDSADPELSIISLSEAGQPDSSIRLADIVRLDLPINLVVLSGCETGRGEPISGDGLLSLSTAFLGAGARTVVASLWKIPDDATSAWMTAFYSALHDRHVPVAQALVAAQNAVRSHPQWRHPYYWSAFTLITANGHSSNARSAIELH